MCSFDTEEYNGFVNPFHLSESYTFSQLAGKTMHELRFWVYGLFPYLAKLYTHLHSSSDAPEVSSTFDFSVLEFLEDSQELEDILEGWFTFAGERQQLQGRDFWRPNGPSRLFIFHLHYLNWFHTLVKSEEGLEQARSLFDDWIDNNPIGSLEGWHPYCISQRLVSLILCWQTLSHGQHALRTRRWLKSMRDQTTFLYLHQETFLGGNHLLENLIALIIASFFWNHKKTGRIFFLDSTIMLEEELKKQILPDGGHCEGSYGYHMTILARLRLLCLFYTAAKHPRPHWLTNTIKAMEKWAAKLSAHLEAPPLFADSWRSAPIEKDMDAKVKHLEVLTDSGLLRQQWNENRDVIIFRYGAFGGKGVPGHGHCDCTSYELFFHGRPFICDSGNLHYRQDSLREYFRSTKGHNVAMMEKVEQSEFSHTFRAGRTTKGELLCCREEEEGAYFHMAYVPATMKNQGLRVHRHVMVIPTRAIVIADSIDGYEGELFHSYVHLTPEAAKAEAEKDLQRLASEGRTLWLKLLAGQSTTTEKGHYAPEFGEHHTSIVLVFSGVKRIVYSFSLDKPKAEETRIWLEKITNFAAERRS